MAQYTDYNGITLYKGSKRLDIGCTDNLQTKIPVIIKPANSNSIDGFNVTNLYPNKCYWLTNVTKNGTIYVQPLDPITTEKNNLIEQNIPIDENTSIETVSSWVQSDYTKGVINHNSIKRIVDSNTVPEGVDIDEFLNSMLKATETSVPESSGGGSEYLESRSSGSSPIKGYIEKDTATPIISAKYDSRYKAEHLKNEISDEEFVDVTLSTLSTDTPEAKDTPHILVEYYFIFAPNGSNTISLPNGYYFADNPRNMTFEQDENGPTVYEVHICNNIVRIGKAIRFGRSPIYDGGGLA